MLKKHFLFILVPLTFLLASCLDSNENTDSASETGRAPSDISVNCTTALSPSCDTANDGKEVYFLWVSVACEDLATGFENDDVGAIKLSTSTCAAGECDSAASAPWAGLDSQGAVTTMPASVTSAAAWLNFTDNGAGDGDGPQTGDLICCAEDQTSAVELTNADCVPIF